MEENLTLQIFQTALLEIINRAPDAIVVYDIEGSVTLWNFAAEQMFGYSRDEALGQNIAQLIRLGDSDTAIDDEEFWISEIQNAGSSLKNTQVVTLLHCHVTPFSAEISLSQINNGPQPLFMATFRTMPEGRSMALEKESLQYGIESLSAENLTLLDAVPAMIWYKDDQNRVLRANRYAADMMGLSKEALEGTSLYDLIPEDAERCHLQDLEIIKTGQPLMGEIEFCHLAPDRQYWLRTDKFPHRDDEGNIIGVIVFSTDITELKQTEAALVASERRFRAVFDNALDAIGILNNEGCYIDVNPATCQFLGLPKEEILGKTPADFMSVEGIPLHEALLEEMQKTGTLSGEVTITCTDGTVRDMEYNMVYNFLQGMHLSVARDITVRLNVERELRTILEQERLAKQALQESEQRFRTMADSAPVLIWMANNEGQGIYFNRKWLEYTGRTLEQELNDGWRECIHPDDLDYTNTICINSKQLLQPFTLEFRLKGADGIYRWFLDTATPRFTPGGEFAGYIGSCVDITEIKETEEALRESEERFRYLADTAPVMIWMSDVGAGSIYFNKPWLEFTGRTFEQEAGHGWLEMVHPDDQESCMQTYLSAFNERRDFRLEYRLRRADGVYRWILDDAKPRITVSGEFLGYIGSCIDITERKEMEIQLKQEKDRAEAAEERYSLVLQGANDGIWDWDIRTGEVYWNDRLYEIHGYERDKFKLTAETFFEQVHPEDRERVADALKAHLERNEKYDLEFRFLNGRTGEYHYIHTRARAIRDENGMPVRMGGISVDIHERIKAEQAIQKAYKRESLVRRIVEQTSKSFDINVILKDVVREVAQFFDADRCSIVRYEKCDDHLDVKLSCDYCNAEDCVSMQEEDFPLKLLHYVANTLPEQEEKAEIICIPDTQDLLENCHQYFRKYNIRAEDLVTDLGFFFRKFQIKSALAVEIYYRGTPYGFISIYQCTYKRCWTKDEIELLGDIATHVGVAFNQVELYHQEQQAKEEAEIANRRKDQFLANMSHELRTPLNAIIGYSEMLEKGMAGDLTDKQMRYTHNVLVSGRHLLDMVNDLLDIAKIEAGHVELFYEWIYLHALIEDVESVFQQSTNQKQITLLFDQEPGLHKIEADSARLRQILFNLVCNAIKFNRQHGQITVRLYTGQENRWFVCDVEDTGIGIARDKIKELFKPFYQIDSSYARQQEGTGLGLVLTKHLVELHGGTIKVSSEEGIGSVFSFTIPMQSPLKVNTDPALGANLSVNV